MPRPDDHTLRAAAVAALMIAAATALHIAGHYSWPLYHSELGLPRSGIYIALFTWWGVSVRRRIIQTQLRRYLTAIAALMVAWMTMRTVKYFFVSDPDVSRQLWYFYYFPMLFIPLLVLFVALSLGKPENFRLPRWTALFYVAAGLLVVFVLTNDMHQLVFTFPGDDRRDSNNGYAFGYWLAVGWNYLCAAAAMLTMLIKCRVPHSRRMIWLPMIPISAAVIYQLVYLSGAGWLRVIFGDMTLIQCLLYVAVLESCIMCGLIRSNSHYTELFRVSTVRAQITDPDYRVILASERAQSFPAGVMRRAGTSPVLLGGVRLSGAPIRAGWVLWEDDVSELAELMRKLEDTREHLRGSNAALAEELKTRRRRQHLAEQNRLYNEMQNKTASQVQQLAQLVEQLAQAGPAQEKALLARTALLAAYLKRRNNLIFLSEDKRAIHSAELYHCLRESLANISLFGTGADQIFELDGTLPFSQLVLIYDTFEQALEYAFDTLGGVFVRTGREGGEPVMRLRLCCGADMSRLAGGCVFASREDAGEWLLTLRMPEGGGEP